MVAHHEVASSRRCKLQAEERARIAEVLGSWDMRKFHASAHGAPPIGVRAR